MAFTEWESFDLLDFLQVDKKLGIKEVHDWMVRNCLFVSFLLNLIVLIHKVLSFSSVILLPMAITFYVTWWFIHFVDGFFSPIYAQLGIDIFGEKLPFPTPCISYLEESCSCISWRQVLMSAFLIKFAFQGLALSRLLHSSSWWECSCRHG